MKRYSLGFVALGVAALGAFFVRGAEVTAQPQPAGDTPAGARVLSVATLAPAGSTWMRVLDAWNRELRRRTNRMLSLRIYPGGVQGDESEVVRKIRSGRLDGAAVTAVGLAQIYRPALTFQMPGMFGSYRQLDAARAATNADIVREFNTAGFAFMGWADVGFSRVFSNRPVAAPSEMAGLHPYVWRDDLVMPAFFREAHVEAVRLQLPEVLSALQTNRVDSFITTPYAAVSLQWSTRATHMTDQNVGVVVGATVFGNTQMNSLSPELQTALRETATQFHQLLINNLRRDEASTLNTLSTRGLTTVQVSAAQRQQWTDLFQRTRAALGNTVAEPAFVQRVQNAAR
ncbi:MAG: TRAP transporter substrate-binding protein DctP [Myxococcales bacterium]|nr:TRAP transporter substrate-binding protein DctP [Myxococcales bacterium]